MEDSSPNNKGFGRDRYLRHPLLKGHLTPKSDYELIFTNKIKLSSQPRSLKVRNIEEVKTVAPHFTGIKAMIN